MSVYKSTAHILANPFEKNPADVDVSFFYPTEGTDWDYTKTVSIYDVKMWQQLYYVAGGVGVYVAHIPKIEFYMITYNIFIDKPAGVETFYGPHAVADVISRAKELTINLPITTDFLTS
jgi:hypothetical protein